MFSESKVLKKKQHVYNQVTEANRDLHLVLFILRMFDSRATWFWQGLTIAMLIRIYLMAVYNNV